MKFLLNRQLSEVSGDALLKKRGGDPTLNTIYIQRTTPLSGVAIATNLLALAVIPVELDPDDVDGPLSANHWPAAIKAVKETYSTKELKERPWGELKLGPEYVEFSNGARVFRLSADAKDGDYSRFEKWREYVPARRSLTQRATSAFAINANLLVDLQKALGTLPFIFLSRTSDTGALLVEVSIPEEGGAPLPPFGLVLPVTFRGEKDEWKKDATTPPLESIDPLQTRDPSPGEIEQKVLS